MSTSNFLLSQLNDSEFNSQWEELEKLPKIVKLESVTMVNFKSFGGMCVYDQFRA